MLHNFLFVFLFMQSPFQGLQSSPEAVTATTPSILLAIDETLLNKSVRGNLYYVATNGNNSGDGSANHPWKSISHAVASNSVVKAGDTITVRPGTYTEQVTLGKSGNSTNGNITLKANGNVILVDPNPTGGSFEDGTIQSYGQSYWDINGFTIKNSPWAGIALHDAKNMIVENNHTSQTGSSGIIVLPGSYYGGGDAEVTSSNIKVLNNTVDQANYRYYEGTTGVGAQESLSIWGVNGFEVAGNIVTNGNTEGIDIKVGSRNGTVHNNDVSGVAAISGTSRHGGPAIYLDGNRANEFNIDVYSNNVHNNHADGIVVADEAPTIASVSNIKIHDNTITSNGTQGINGGIGIGILPDVKNVEIYNNTVDKNVQAFYFDGGTIGVNVLNVHNNKFTNSTYRNGFVGNDVNNLTFSNNTLSKNYQIYDTSGTQINLQASGNTFI